MDLIFELYTSRVHGTSAKCADVIPKHHYLDSKFQKVALRGTIIYPIGLDPNGPDIRAVPIYTMWNDGKSLSLTSRVHGTSAKCADVIPKHHYLDSKFQKVALRGTIKNPTGLDPNGHNLRSVPIYT